VPTTVPFRTTDTNGNGSPVSSSVILPEMIVLSITWPKDTWPKRMADIRKIQKINPLVRIFI
jgi:hypothetical protein